MRIKTKFNTKNITTLSYSQQKKASTLIQLLDQYLKNLITSTINSTSNNFNKYYRRIIIVNINNYQMGNQESLMFKNAIYQDEGKYIVPTKIKIPEQTQSTEIIKNIFGVEDPALLTRSYWAKNPNKKTNSLQRNLQKSPSKSRRLQESSVGVASRHHANEWAQQSIVRPQREMLGKSIVSNFRQDLKQTPSRHLSKITSCSIISKLNQFQGDLQSTSAIKHNQKSSISNIFSHKNKQNYNHQQLGSPIKSSQRARKTEGMQNSALKKSRLSQIRQSQVKGNSVLSQVNKIFGVSDVSQPSHKDQKQENHQNQNHFQSRQNRQQLHLEPNHNRSGGNNFEMCEQTFSRIEQNPALLCSSLQDKASQKSNNFDILSKKTHSRHSEIEKFDGLNEDSKNESLMKVLKKITETSVDISAQAKKPPIQTRNHPIRQNTSQVMNENVHQMYEVTSKKSSKQSQKSQTLKSSSTQKYEEPPFEFFLHEVKNTGSQKSSNAERSISNKTSSNYSHNQGNPIYSEVAKANSKSLSKQSIYGLTQIYQKNKRLPLEHNDNIFAYLDNEESQQTEQKIQNSNDDYFKCSKLKSPKSITSQQVGLNRQRSCAGRIIQTSKAVNTKEYSSPFKSKKYDFTKKQPSKHEKSPSKHNISKKSPSKRQSNSPSEVYYAQTYNNRSPSHKSPSQKSTSKTLDYQLMMKISTLEGQLQNLKLKSQLEKFQSRRYSPVKQERSKRRVPMNEQDYSVSQNEQEPKYCINEMSRSTPFKHRAQYFKLKLK